MNRLLLTAALAAWAAAASLLALPAWADDEPVGLRFSQFFRQPVGPRGLELQPALREASGRRVRLVGYMVAQEQPQPGQFLLTPRPVRMSEHADGEADDLPPATVTVRLAPTQADWLVPHREGPVALVGRLEVGREEAADGRVSWVRLHLAPDALQPDTTAR